MIEGTQHQLYCYSITTTTDSPHGAWRSPAGSFRETDYSVWIIYLLITIII